MLLENVKEVLMKVGDLRLLSRENKEVRITDLFLNGDGQIRLEQYSTINKEDAIKHSDDKIITEESIEMLLSCIKLWSLFDGDNESISENPEINSFLEDIKDYLSNHNLENLEDLSRLNYNQPVIEFFDNDKDKMLYIAVSNVELKR